MTRSPFSFKRLVLASSLAGLAVAAMAQTPPTAPPAPDAPARHAQEHARHDAHKHRASAEQRQARLKEALKITAAQEPAWNVYTASLLPPGPRDRAGRPDREALKAMTTPQRIEHLRAMQAARAAEMERRTDAVLRLYAALTPEQQKLFDERGGMGMGMGMGPHHGPRHHRG